MLVLVWMVKWKSFAFVQLKYCDHLALLTCKSINIRIPNIISTGHDLETCCYDRYRGSNFKPVGSFCKEVWLSSIDRGWEHKVCINLSSNYSELQCFVPNWIVLLVVLPVGIEIHASWFFFWQMQSLQNPTCICCWCRCCTYCSLEGWRQ